MRHYALIGHSLTHSLSKELFDAQGFTDADYRLCPMASLEDLRQWVQQEHIDGFNVTNPYKQALVPLLDNLSPEARAIGAVNCVCVENGLLVGHNTDAPAFRQTLETILKTEHLTLDTAYILGTGGAAHAVAYALDQLSIPYHFVSRSPEKRPNSIGYNQLSTINFQQSTLLVNATPVGTYPNVDDCPLPSGFQFSILNSQFLYDLVYNPSPTLLLRQAAAAGAMTYDGLAMLRRQAELSWKLWGLTNP